MDHSRHAATEDNLLAQIAGMSMADEWGNSPFDRLRNELVARIERSDALTERVVGKLEAKVDREIEDIKTSKAAKWVETAMGAVMAACCMAVLGAVLSLVIITRGMGS
jgi:hypothetical protein